MARLFGTDGVRGVANTELTASMAYDIGKAAAYVLAKEGSRPVFVIGRDTRLSGDMLENALTAGILSIGGNVIKLGIMPTPAVAYLVRYYDADAGVVISASHNPFEYNGIKIFNGDGFKLEDDVEDEIEAVIESGEYTAPCTGSALGRCLEAEEDALGIYTDFLLSTIDSDLQGMKIILDCANGAAYKTARIVYEALGADIYILADDPDGININDNCGSTHPKRLQEKVIETGADMGLAFDGDADRLIAVDDKGRILDGDYIMCICASMLQSDGTLFGDRVTATVMSNIGLHKYFNCRGIDVDITQVGDRYVLESMLKTGSIIGGEQSGHMIFLNYATTGDGVLSSLQFVKAVRMCGLKVSELRDEITIYPQVLVNARVTNDNKNTIMDDPHVMKIIGDVEDKIGDTGRVLIRPSGTEPLVRVMLEGKDAEELCEYANDLAQFIEARFGAKR